MDTKKLPKVTIESMRESVILWLSAIGVPPVKIAEVTGETEFRITHRQKDFDFQSRQKECEDFIFGDDAALRFKMMGPEAIRAIGDLLQSEKDSVKYSAAVIALERAYGKTAQPIDVRVNVIRSLLEKMDSQRAEKQEKVVGGTLTAALPAGSSAAIEAEEKHPMDAWVEEHLGG